MLTQIIFHSLSYLAQGPRKTLLKAVLLVCGKEHYL